MEFVSEFRLQGERSLFNNKDKYSIPLYQRAYSWTEKEIEQLIEDINDFEDDCYYLGSLIVYKREDKYEVIDGQQRLTTIYILFNALGLDNYGCLEFDCREKSNYTLKHLSSNKSDDNMRESTIIDGKEIILNKFNKDKINKEDFINKLSKVILYRIEVPPHTDLNRYFEIMNTRGEQLEQHDILKASLMNYLKTGDGDAFALIWDACSDMTGYVQMHFPRKYRDDLFGPHWNDLNFNDINTNDINNTLFDKLLTAIEKSNKDEKINKDISESNNEETIKKESKNNGISIKEILKPSFNIDDINIDYDKEERVRFESIIDFPYFLLHVLKVMIHKEDIKNKDSKKSIINELLDDKKLLDAFNNVIDNGQWDGKDIDKYKFSITYIEYLIKSRFLFDEYIIKREYSLDNNESTWSIKSLDTSGQQAKKKPYYSNTDFHKKNEHKVKDESRNKSNIMIQSCLRVSYTSPKIMHWITDLLIRLNDVETDQLFDFDAYAEKYAKNKVNDDFIEAGNYKLGVNTPHIVFNYLDYLIWKEDKQRYKDFQFEFRTSVEHFYPQHPSDGTFSTWEDVDTFGNLCLVQRNINSKFSNMSPEAKKSTFKEMISKGSLKLRIMDNKLTSSEEWKNSLCDEHEKEMIDKLKRYINKY